MKNQHRLKVAIPALLAACTAAAQTVYKSVDAQGRVTYSSSPPAAQASEFIEKVQIAPGPSQQQKMQAKQRTKGLTADAAKGKKERQEQDAQRAEASLDAAQELRKAQIALEEARMISDDDWDNPPTGARVLNQSYRDRVEAAERGIRDAKKSLREAPSGER